MDTFFRSPVLREARDTVVCNRSSALCVSDALGK